MGACASCLRGRNKTSSSEREREPLLSVGNDNDSDLNDAVDQQSQQRQQQLGHIVQTTHEYFIDIPSVDGPDQLEASEDVSERIQKLKSRLPTVELEIPNVKDLTPEHRQQLETELQLHKN